MELYCDGGCLPALEDVLQGVLGVMGLLYGGPATPAHGHNGNLTHERCRPGISIAGAVYSTGSFERDFSCDRVACWYTNDFADIITYRFINL